MVGLGGLGHMAVKLAAAMGAEVTMLSTSKAKEADARRLGATGFAPHLRQGHVQEAGRQVRLHPRHHLRATTTCSAYLGLLKVDGALVLVGVPSEPAQVHAMSFIFGRKTLAGSLIGGIAETQEMLDFCGKHGITSDVEVIPVEKVNEAYERTSRPTSATASSSTSPSLRKGG